MDPALKELMEGSGEDEIEAIIRLDPEGTLPPHVRVVSRFGEIATVRLPRARIAETWADESVVSLKAARPFGLDPDPLPFDASLETAESFADRDDTRRPEGLDATGRGTVVAVLDWGFDFAHPNFRRRDGSTRALALWDQSAPGSGPRPYGYGRVYTREEIDRALRHDEPYRALGYHPATGDPTGYGAHGTHVLDIAAGNGRAEGSPSGIAPEADLLFVHLATRGTEGRANLGDSVTLLEALDWVARQAGDRPWVVNLSVGRHGGPHTGLTLVEQGIDALLAAGPGRAVVQSTGNYFGANVHASGYLRPGQKRTLRWWTDRADVTPNELEVWYPGVDAFEVEVRSPHSQDTEAEVRVPLGGQASIQVDGREAGRVYHRAKDPGNGDNHVDVFLYPHAPAGCWQVILIGEDVVDGRFHAWVERDPGCPTCQSRLDPGDADPTTTTGTIANGFRSIAVGAYDAHSGDRRLGAFSSAGPTRDGRLKPDLLAPGVSVLAARSASLELGSDTPLLTRNSGTSMAAPHVTGTVALMFEVAPRPLAIQETRKLLLSTARETRFEDEPAARLGSGYLDVERAVEAARSFGVPAGPKSEAVEDFEEILEQAAQEPEPAWIVPGETETFDDGGAPELEESMEDERDIHPCGCAAREAETETFESEAELPCECGCRGGDREEEEDETTRWEPEWGSAEPEWEELESEEWEPAIEIAEPAELLAGWWEGEISPATLFDCMVAGGAARRHLEAAFEVLALPCEISLDPPQEGDLVVRRALGEGSLAQMTTVTTEYDVPVDPVGRMPFDQLLVRPRAAVPAWRESTWESSAWESTAAACAGPATVLDRFDSDSSKLLPDHDPILDKLAKEIVDSHSTTAPVEAVCAAGHTDDSGSKGHNTGLGKDRAKAAEAALRKKVKALSPAVAARLLITPTSQGEDSPVASNSTADGKAKNRRVEITLGRGVKRICPQPPVSTDDPTALDLFPVGSKDFGPVTVAVGSSSPTIQGSVFFPADSAGGTRFNKTITAPVPIVFMAHGNHRAFTDPAHPDTDHCTDTGGLTPVRNHEGFDYFQRLLARMGIIAVSVDCNSTCDFGSSTTNVMDRATLVLGAMMHFRSGGDPALAGHADFDRVGLMGHSRGGEAVLALAEGITGVGLLLSFLGINLGVTIRGVLALAPTAFGATSGRPAGFPFLTILPAADGDVTTNAGAQFYDQAVPGPFKGQLYVHDANHNFFNRQWTNDDTRGEPGLLLRARHEAILSAYGCAFFRDVLLGHAMRKFLRADELPPGVPADRIHISFEQAGPTTVDDHEDASIATNALGQATGQSGGLTARQCPFTQSTTACNNSFFGNTVGMEARSTTASGRFRSPLAAAADLTGKEVWIRAAEVYNGSSIPAGATGFRVGLEDAAGTLSFADSKDAGGLPRPFHRRALDRRLFGAAAGVDRTKTMPKTLRFQSTCFAKKGFDLTRVRAIVIELNRGDKRRLAFDQLQIV